MSIFNGFLIVVIAVVCFMLPFTGAIYDFRTDLREDSFNYTTGIGETTANVTLHKAIYDSDTDTMALTSDLPTDLPLLVSYNVTNRLVVLSGLIANTARTLGVSYDINALEDNEALDTFLGWIPYIWLILVACLPIAAIYSIIKSR